MPTDWVSIAPCQAAPVSGAISRGHGTCMPTSRPARRNISFGSITCHGTIPWLRESRCGMSFAPGTNPVSIGFSRRGKHGMGFQENWIRSSIDSWHNFLRPKKKMRSTGGMSAWPISSPTRSGRFPTRSSSSRRQTSSLSVLSCVTLAGSMPTNGAPRPPCGWRSPTRCRTR